jgi:hypothetical protein
MSKKNILASVRKMTEDILKTTDMELIDLEYVKEGPFKYLRIYIDKPGGVNVDDTADVSRILSKKLDEADKMVMGDKIVSCEERFTKKEEIYKDDPEALKAVKHRKRQAMELYNSIINLEGEGHETD